MHRVCVIHSKHILYGLLLAEFVFFFTSLFGRHTDFRRLEIESHTRDTAKNLLNGIRPRLPCLHVFVYMGLSISISLSLFLSIQVSVCRRHRRRFRTH